MRIRATAPGKLVIMGDYAVTDGHAALVAAVDVRAVVERVDGPLEIARDAGGLVDAVLAVCGDVGGRVVVDTAAFRAQNRKYGLGSSAAACVALVRAFLPDVSVDEVHVRAQRAHRAFQHGQGSGVDVAASAYGGLVRFVRPDPDDDATEATPVAPPPGRTYAGLLPRHTTVLPVFTGVSADTRAFLAAVGQVPDRKTRLAVLGDCAERFAGALLRGDQRELFAAVDDAAVDLAALGDAAHVPIVSREHQRIRRIAVEHGGAAKPSGAGGGDVALVFVDVDAAAACRTALEAEGFLVLDLQLFCPGVDVVSPPT